MTPELRRSRRNAAALIVSAALAATVVPGVAGSTASATGALAPVVGATAVLAAPDAPPAGRAWIEGQVVDQAGRPHDQVLVEAFAADALDEDPEAEPVSSSLTYAASADGPEHGFFRLYVARGEDTTYDLRFSSPEDAADPFRTRMVRGVEVGADLSAGVVVDQGAVVLRLQRLAEASVSLRADRHTSSPRRTGRLVVEVTSPDVDPVTGKIRMRIDGRGRAQRQLTPRRDGRAVFTVPALRPGGHTLAVRFAGSRDVESAAASTQVVVEKPARKNTKAKGKKAGKGKQDAQGKKGKKGKKGSGKKAGKGGGTKGGGKKGGRKG